MTYDRHAHVQKKAAADLLAFTGPCDPRRIVEPGCGTGIYSRMLADAFPGAAILGVDIAEERVAQARRNVVSPAVRFEALDAEEMPAVPCDLVTSNATFQWFRRLPDTIARFARMLDGGGVLTFSFFGPGTFAELEDATREVLGDGVRVAASAFAGPDAVCAALSAAFPRVRIEDTTYSRTFPSLLDLLRSIKGTETRGAPALPETRWSRGTLARIEDAYRHRCGAIRATYRVRFCKGER